MYPFDLDWYQANNFFYIEDTLGLEDGQLHSLLQDTIQSILDVYTTNEFVPSTTSGQIYSETLNDSEAQGWTVKWSEYTASGYSGEATWNSLYEQEGPIYNATNRMNLEIKFRGFAIPRTTPDSL